MQSSFLIVDFLTFVDVELRDFESFEEFVCIGYCTDIGIALDTILEKKPNIIFFHVIDETNFTLLSELYSYLEILPYFIILHKDATFAFRSLKNGVNDYLLLPLEKNELRKTFLKYKKSVKFTENEILCIRANGDHHFIKCEDILYVKADSNTTDFYLCNETIVTGFKSMKYFESQLPFYFFRIHNSYIVNINHVSRINISKTDCYLSENSIKIPFSRSYKAKIDLIIKRLR